MSLPALPYPDVVVLGAGIIGLAVALEFRQRGAQVTVLERDQAFSHASAAAAGMLAAHDPHNPTQLQSLSDLSIRLYDRFLETIREHSGHPVPYQTAVAHQYLQKARRTLLQEHSLDPRQLAPALLVAAKNLNVTILEHQGTETRPSSPIVIRTTGAWASSVHVTPLKGQMLRVQLPWPALTEVHRAEHVYVVPRTHGPQAGTALIGATVEDVGFDLTTHQQDLQRLGRLAAELHPELRFLAEAPQLDAWAGLRPSTPDGLPVIGRLSESEFIATGHFRNGILLAPATARALADLVQNKPPAVDMLPFRPERFTS